MCHQPLEFEGLRAVRKRRAIDAASHHYLIGGRGGHPSRLLETGMIRYFPPVFLASASSMYGASCSGRSWVVVELLGDHEIDLRLSSPNPCSIVSHPPTIRVPLSIATVDMHPACGRGDGFHRSALAGQASVSDDVLHLAGGSERVISGGIQLDPIRAVRNLFATAARASSTERTTVLASGFAGAVAGVALQTMPSVDT